MNDVEMYEYLIQKDKRVLERLLEQWYFDEKMDKLFGYVSESNEFKIVMTQLILRNI